MTEVIMIDNKVLTDFPFLSIPAGPAAVLAWEEAFTAGPETCGGKGYNLGRLHRYGFRIPRGGVIPAGWYAEILKLAPEGALAFIRDVPG